MFNPDFFADFCSLEQILKAIHNYPHNLSTPKFAVSDVKDNTFLLHKPNFI